MPWNPDWATHPGDHLREHIEASGLDADAFCARRKLGASTVKAVIDRRIPVTYDIAERLELLTGLRAEIWMGLQRRWDERQRLERSS
jgi:HTH-type transcriptional regulator/antitoxin HigA